MPISSCQYMLPLIAVLYSQDEDPAQCERQGRDHRPAAKGSSHELAPLGKDGRSPDGLSLERWIQDVHGLEACEPGKPALSPHSSCDQRSLNWIILLFRCDLDHGLTVEVQPTFVEKRTSIGRRRDQALAHNASLPPVLVSRFDQIATESGADLRQDQLALSVRLEENSRLWR